MQRVAIVIAATKRYETMLAIALLSLKKTNEHYISKIIVMHDDFSKESLDSFKQIWGEKILLKPYYFDDFLLDVGLENKHLLDNFSNLNSNIYMMYARYYLYEFINDYDVCVWIEADSIIRSSIKGFIDETIELSGTFWTTSKLEKYYKFYTNEAVQGRKFCSMGGMPTVVKNSILTKTGKADLKKECFKYLVKYLKILEFEGKKEVVAGTDEMCNGFMAYRYDLHCKDLVNINTLPHFSSADINPVIHLGNAGKFNSQIFLLSYQEYLQYNKEWILQYKRPSQLKPNKTTLDIKTQSQLYKYLYVQDLFAYFYPNLFEILVKDFAEFKLFLREFHKTPFICIDSPLFNNKFFIRLILPTDYREELYMQLCFKDDKLFTQISTKCKNYKLFYKGEPYVKYIAKLRQFLHILNGLKTQFSCISHSCKFDYSNFIYEFKLFLNEVLSLIKPHLNFKFIEQNPLNYSAKTRIRSHLAYKLGQALILNSKSLKGYIRMPYVLSYIKDKHKAEQKAYNEKISKNPSLKLPPLQSYPDYKEALKEKECITYKLGEALIQNMKRGGAFKYMRFYLDVRRIKKEFKLKSQS